MNCPLGSSHIQIKDLTIRRRVKEALQFYFDYINSLDKKAFDQHRTNRHGAGKRLEEEYYPLCQYTLAKHAGKDYFVCLCEGKKESEDKIDAEISDSQGQKIESIQITCIYDKKEALRENKLRQDGFSLGVGKCYLDKKANTIVQEDALRSPETALDEIAEKIFQWTRKKLLIETYVCLDVLLVVSEYRLWGYIDHERLKKVLHEKLASKVEQAKRRFKEVYLVDCSKEPATLMQIS